MMDFFTQAGEYFFGSDLFFSYIKEHSFGAFVLAVSAYVLITVLVMSLLRILTGEKFRCGWRSVLWAFLPAVMLLPFKVITPLTIIPIGYNNFPVHLKSPELPLSGVTEIHKFSTTAKAEEMLLDEYLLVIWLIGFVLQLGYEAVMFIRLKRKMRGSSIVCSNKKFLSALEKISGELKIKTPALYIFPEVDTPFAAGIFKPRIMLPGEDFSEEEINFIFRHEGVHIKRRDIAVKLGMILFRCANWFNPAAYVMCRLAFEDMEITCDERAAKGFTDDMRERYSKTILRGVSRNRYSAVTTYLSSTAAMLKKRISAVITKKRFGSAIPFTAALASVMLLCSTVCAFPTDIIWYAYTCPYPMESDPYITTEEWKTCTAENAEEAGEIIFRQYMDMYTGEDVPDYLRIEDYFITNVHSYDRDKIRFSPVNNNALTVMGFLDSNEFASVTYNVSYANKCGNTAHNLNFGNSLYFNGYAEGAVIGLELERKGNTFTAVNMGTIDFWGSCTYHFKNKMTGKYGTLAELSLMAKLGILDKNRDLSEESLSPDEICSFAYYRGKRLGEDPPSIGYAYLPFHVKPDQKALKYSSFADPETKKITGGSPLSAADFELCGIEFDPQIGSYKVYGNVTGENSHGVILDFNNPKNDQWFYNVELTKITVTGETYSPVVYRDSFDSIPLPEEIKKDTAEDILEYMKTPRNGCDFTVLDYSAVSEEKDGVYADVRFKGRLEGVYSSDMLEEKQEPVMRVKIK